MVTIESGTGTADMTEFYEKLLRTGIISPNTRTRKPEVLFRGSGIVKLTEDLALSVNHERRKAFIGLRVDNRIAVAQSGWHFDVSKSDSGVQLILGI